MSSSGLADSKAPISRDFPAFDPMPKDRAGQRQARYQGVDQHARDRIACRVTIPFWNLEALLQNHQAAVDFLLLAHQHLQKSCEMHV
jgi:hypothetical protein